jgi:GntR family transcriptional regulator, transcriptional repressor for pyruvate dehydrogenase complex
MVARGAEQIILPQNLTDRITVALREHIARGEYAPGRQLPAGRDLSRTFGVSITVIREALSRLKADGLVASRQGKGVFVASDAKARPFRLVQSSGAQRALSEIFELRMGVEVQAAGLAAKRRTARDLAVMTRCLKAMAPSQKPFEQGLKADLGFHRAIAEATRNPLIVSFMEFLQPHLHEAIALARANSARKPETEAEAYQEHLDIFEAIAAQDPRQAETAVRRVLDGSLQRLGA